MNPFKPGQQLLCVDDRHFVLRGAIFNGKIYTVRAVNAGLVYLEGQAEDAGFYWDRFVDAASTLAKREFDAKFEEFLK